MKRVILIIFLTIPLFAENILKEFITSKSITLKEMQNLKEEFSKAQFDSFLFKKLRLNMNYSEFDKNIEDEYEARIYPKSFSQIEIEKKIYNLKKNQIDNIYEKSHLKLLLGKFNLILEIYLKKKEYKLNQKILELNQKKLDISSKNIENFSNIFDIAKLKREVQSMNFELKEQKLNYENTLLYIKRFITQYSIDDINRAFDNFQFISISKLLNYINKSNFNNTTQMLKDEEINLEIAKYEKELKEIEDNFRINSVDVKYENDKDLNRAFSIGVSLEFPLSKSNNMEEKLNILKANSNLNLKQEELNYQILRLTQEIKILSEKFLYYKESLESDTFYDTYLTLQNPNPLIILDLQFNHLKIQKDMIEIKYKLYSKFINLLYITNNLNENIFF